MANKAIRIAMIDANIKGFELAKYLGIRETELSRRLRYELTDTEREEMLQAIHKMTEKARGLKNDPGRKDAEGSRNHSE